MFLLCCGNMIAVRRREKNILLGGLWEFPNTAGTLSTEQAHNLLSEWGISFSEMTEGLRKKHIFTHVEWDMVSYLVSCENTAPEFQWVTREKLAEEMALPSAFQPFFSGLETAAGGGNMPSGLSDAGGTGRRTI